MRVVLPPFHDTRPGYRATNKEKVAEWVANLKTLQDEETKRQANWEEQLSYQIKIHNWAVEDFKLAGTYTSGL